MSTVYYLSLIVEALRSIDPHQLAEEEAPHGICDAVRSYIRTCAPQPVTARSCAPHGALDQWYIEKDAIVQSWPMFSGDPAYPVPSSSMYAVSPMRAYDMHQQRGTLWRGRQGALRCDLIEHLIEGFEQLLADATEAARQEALQGPVLRFSKAPDPDLYHDW